MPTTTGDPHPPPRIPLVPSISDAANVQPIQHQQHFKHRRGASQQSLELQDLPSNSPSSSASAPKRHVPRIRTHHGFEANSFFASDESDLDSSAEAPMSKRKGKSPNPRAAAARGDSIDSNRSNGHASGAMDNLLGQRRKHVGPDSPSTASQASHLMSRDSFTLDDDPMQAMTHDEEGTSKGFSELPKKDQKNFLLLVLLYFLQGVPMGLAGGSVPFLLKAHLSYSQIGVFSLASYPYSLKLLWSPIVDAIWSPKVGRRKSWILPIQTLSGFGMLWLGARAEKMMIQAGADGGAGIWGFTWWWFFLVFMCATQDIAVDGWALTLLSPENLSYASTAQTVGLTAGQFLSYTVFLAFNSPDFANKWFRATPKDEGVMTLGGYLTFWGWAYLAVTLALALMKREEKTKNNDGISEVYRVMGGILKLRNIQTFIVIHLIAKIGFQANDAVTNLKLLDKGFSQEDMALTVLIDFPFELSLGYYAGKWSQTYPPMQLWCWAFVGRLVAAAFAQFVVMIFPSGGVTTWYLLTVIVEHVFSTFMSTVMFVAISAFHAKIADPVIGGTYMTLLATVSNLGGTFPRFFILKFVDFFTVATCSPPTTPPADLKGELVTSQFSCALEGDKHRCIDGGGSCNIEHDGYYIVNVLCIIVGVVTFWGFIKPAALKLQSLPLRAWRLSGAS
ncbi:Major facilitator superfamily domain general substrate transporter [Macrophomina phaseolina MS6]|uniref:Major facilitator superfamily domain general substrate transporter n=1 Tax=Macrophomina phaseolina (strain MS6) TaxID=1126212 RepID=K2QP19_MACPH|nr:Major facilitator superfamily domain general substrate transporter [Macrophomina phaseolina MS6]